MTKATFDKHAGTAASDPEVTEFAELIVDEMIAAEEFIRRLDESPRTKKTESEQAEVCRLIEALRSAIA